MLMFRQECRQVPPTAYHRSKSHQQLPVVTGNVEDHSRTDGYFLWFFTHLDVLYIYKVQYMEGVPVLLRLPSLLSIFMIYCIETEARSFGGLLPALICKTGSATQIAL
jgi:hypothetical protein